MSDSKYSIYECPARDNGYLPWIYISEVYLAWKQLKKQVQFKNKFQDNNSWLDVVGQPTWAWDSLDYRIKPEINIEELGKKALEEATKKGYVVGGLVKWNGAFYTIDEVYTYYPNKVLPSISTTIDYINLTLDYSKPFVLVRLNDHKLYIPVDFHKVNPNFYAIKKTREVMSSEDYPPIFWVRFKDEEKSRLLQEISSKGIILNNSRLITFAELAAGFEYSTDRKTWKSCYKEIDL